MKMYSIKSETANNEQTQDGTFPESYQRSKSFLKSNIRLHVERPQDFQGNFQSGEAECKLKIWLKVLQKSSINSESTRTHASLYSLGFGKPTPRSKKCPQKRRNHASPLWKFLEETHVE